VEKIKSFCQLYLYRKIGCKHIKQKSYTSESFRSFVHTALVFYKMLSIGHWMASFFLLYVIWCDTAHASATAAAGAAGTAAATATAAAGVAVAGTVLLPVSLVVGVGGILLGTLFPASIPAVGTFIVPAMQATTSYSVATGVSVAAGTAVASSSTTLFGSSQWSLILLSSVLLVYFLVKQ
jgi:hypothetical protein